MGPSGVSSAKTMTARIPQTLTRLRPAARRRGDRVADRVEDAPAPQPAAERADEARAREAGGPEDRCHYTCCCGMVFTAPVSASVHCPVCGADQDW
jgi:hypothetical protein